MIKAAVVGCGAIADSHAWAMQSTDGCSLVAACDAEPLMAKQFADRFGVDRTYTDVGEMLREARPDVLHILTPPRTHYALAKQCLEHGCHAYVEKPFTLYPDEAAKLCALADQKKLKLTVGHDALFSPAARKMRGMIQSGYLGGSPVHMECYYGYEFGNTYGNALLTDQHHWVRSLPGKLLHNIISHGIARIAEFISVDQPRVIAHGFVSPLLQGIGEKEIIDELRVIIDDGKGATAYFTFSSQMRPTVNQFRVFGPKNGLFLDEMQQLVVQMSGHRYKSYAEQFIPPVKFARQYLSCLRHNLGLFARNEFHVESGKKHLTEVFYRSILEGTEEPIPYQKIILTAWIMNEIFEQLSAKPAVARPAAAPDQRPAWSPPIKHHSMAESAAPAPAALSARPLKRPVSPKTFMIVNADDWGRTREETEAAKSCIDAGLVTAIGVMVFMEDSELAAELAKSTTVEIGLHLNLCETLSGKNVPGNVFRAHQRVARFLESSKYALIFYHPFLTKQFRIVYEAQVQEFFRLYGRYPAFLNGHKHRHLCTNMLLDEIIPHAFRIRRSFSFWAGDKSLPNRLYRRLVDSWIKRRYTLTNYFFSLRYCLAENRMPKVEEMAHRGTVELMVHPVNPEEAEYLKSEAFAKMLRSIPKGTFGQL